MSHLSLPMYLPTCTYLPVPACLPTDSYSYAYSPNLDRQLAEESRLSLPISTFMQAVYKQNNPSVGSKLRARRGAASVEYGCSLDCLGLQPGSPVPVVAGAEAAARAQLHRVRRAAVVEDGRASLPHLRGPGADHAEQPRAVRPELKQSHPCCSPSPLHLPFTSLFFQPLYDP